MELSDIIKNIVLIANGLDARGNQPQAVALDKVASDLSMVKTAQYMGIQGVAVRNSRCWQGCFRHKRAQGMRPQEAWSECHSEYVSAVSGNVKTWNKYASSGASWEREPMGGDFNLQTIIEAKVSSGTPSGIAIPEAVAEHAMAIPDRMVRCSNEMGKVASFIQSKDPATSGRLRVAASCLRDEAWEITKASLPDEA